MAEPSRSPPPHRPSGPPPPLPFCVQPNVPIQHGRLPRTSSLPQQLPIPARINVTTEISSAIEHRPSTLRQQCNGMVSAAPSNTHEVSHHLSVDEAPSAPPKISSSKRRRPSGLVPRSGGFAVPRGGSSNSQPSIFGAYFNYSDSSHCLEYSRSRHFNDIRRLLDEEVPDAIGHRRDRSSMGTLFRSHSEPRRWSAKEVRKNLFGKKEIPRNVIRQKTTDGTKYGRIVTDGVDWSKPPKVEQIVSNRETDERRIEGGRLYGIDKDWGHTITASTDQVNKSEKSGRGKGHDDAAKARSPLVSLAPTGRKSHFAEAVSSRGNGSPLPGPGALPQELAPRPSSGFQIRERDPRVPQVTDFMGERPPPLLPLPKSESLHFDFDSMRSKMEHMRTPAKDVGGPKRSPSPASRTAVGPIDQPTLRHDSATPRKRGFSSILQNIQRRSRSPTKRKADEKGASGWLSQDAGEPSRFRQHIDMLRDADTSMAAIPIDMPNPPPQDVSPEKEAQVTQRSATSSKPSAVTNGHSKSPSMVSAGSTVEDVQSDTSSAVLSDAHSVTVNHVVARKLSRTQSKTPPLPGPPPTTALPAVPESRSGDVPATPRNSTSDQRQDAAEHSPARMKTSPEKYSPFPKNSPTKRPRSPTRRNANDGHASAPGRDFPAVLVKIHSDQQSPTLEQFPAPPDSPPKVSPAKDRRRGMAVVPAPLLPAELSGSTVEPKKIHNVERMEMVADKKMRDMARRRSQRAEMAKAQGDQPPPSSGVTARTESNHIEASPITESHSSLEVVSAYSEQQPRGLSDTIPKKTGHRHRGSNVSQMSPVFVIAEQVPDFPNQLTISQEYRLNGDGISGIRAADHHGSEVSTHLRDTDGVRPPLVSSVPPPPKARPAARRAPTPHTPDLLRQSSNRSSQRSSMLETNMEARVFRLENSNKMLVRAFMAVVDATAEMSTSGSESVGWLSGVENWSAAGRKSGASGTVASDECVGHPSDFGERNGANGGDRLKANGVTGHYARDSGREFEDAYSRLEQILLGRY